MRKAARSTQGLESAAEAPGGTTAVRYVYRGQALQFFTLKDGGDPHLACTRAGGHGQVPGSPLHSGAVPGVSSVWGARGRAARPVGTGRPGPAGVPRGLCLP